MTPELLARLTASGIEPSRIKYSGGVPEHTLGEIAGCLAGCSLGAQYYAAVFYRGAQEYRAKLMSEIRLTLAGEDWEIRKPGILQGLAWLAIAEETPESTRCPTCGGIGSKTVRFKVIECRACGGSGRRTIKKPHDYLGVNRRNWERTWRERYERKVRPIMDRWRSEVWRAVFRGLKEG